MTYRAPLHRTHLTGWFLAGTQSGLARYPPPTVLTRVEDVYEYFRRPQYECQLIQSELVDLIAREYQAFLKNHPSLQFKEGDRLWVGNRTDQPGLHPKLDRIRQASADTRRKFTHEYILGKPEW